LRIVILRVIDSSIYRTGLKEKHCTFERAQFNCPESEKERERGRERERKRERKREGERERKRERDRASGL
jgi:hypothetical protein